MVCDLPSLLVEILVAVALRRAGATTCCRAQKFVWNAQAVAHIDTPLCRSGAIFGACWDCRDPYCLGARAAQKTGNVFVCQCGAVVQIAMLATGASELAGVCALLPFLQLLFHLELVAFPHCLGELVLAP